jgi:plasmid stabilization system protein ParE
MPHTVIVSPEVEEWLNDYFDKLTDDSPASAMRLSEKVRAKFGLLGDFPRIGVKGLIPGTRTVFVHPFTLTVQVREGVVEIAAIRAQRQGDSLAPDGLEEGVEFEEPSGGTSFKK